MLNVGGGGDRELLAYRAESQNRNVRVSCISWYVVHLRHRYLTSSSKIRYHFHNLCYRYRYLSKPDKLLKSYDGIITLAVVHIEIYSSIYLPKLP